MSILLSNKYIDIILQAIMLRGEKKHNNNRAFPFGINVVVDFSLIFFFSPSADISFICLFNYPLLIKL